MISVIHHCQSNCARKLYIRDFTYKSTHSNHYDIGGTYTGSESDLWFYMTTSTYAETGCLINLFVCHRKLGNVSINITVNGVTSTCICKSSKPNENYHIKTVLVTEALTASLKDDTLYIPIKIIIEPKHLTNPEVMRNMKIQNSLGEQLLKQKNTDFILESKSRTQYPVHKLMLCAHSPVLRELVKNSTKTTEFLDITDSDMDMLIQFLYTGAVKDFNKVDCMRLQDIAGKFELSNLFLLAQHLICDKINLKNAIEIAVLAKKYNMSQLWVKVSSFIVQNPAVLTTEGWKSLQDVELAKQLFAFTLLN